MNAKQGAKSIGTLLRWGVNPFARKRNWSIFGREWPSKLGFILTAVK